VAESIIGEMIPKALPACSALRLGGGMTVVAGLIASRFGPAIGGLFLAIPAIESTRNAPDFQDPNVERMPLPWTPRALCSGALDLPALLVRPGF
jgi:hypothetical protein